MHFQKMLVLLVCSLATLVASVAKGQSTNASLSGQVTDIQGLVIVGVDIEAVNEATNVSQKAKTNGAGFYVFPDLAPGTYEVRISRTGFRTMIRPGIIMHVNDALALNATLQVGDSAEIVRVEGGIPLINTTDATVSTTIDRNFAENIPLNGRSFQTLILLTPGSVMTPAGGDSNGGQISVNGQRANSNGWSVDGVTSPRSVGFTTSAELGPGFNGANPALSVAGTTQNLVSVDALQEFKIQTSTYAPEFGRQSGGQISLLTRSGANAFHGTAFDYLRNDAFDANNWFNDAHNPFIPKGKERQNDFGGTLSGPILRDKTFFFFSYEGLRLLQPTTLVLTVPSLRVRQEAAPAFQAILNSWPLPDGPESTDSSGNPTGVAPYTQSLSNPSSIDSISVRLDQAIGKKLHLFGRYAYGPSDAESRRLNLSTGTSLKSGQLTLGLDALVSRTLNNELRLAYSINKGSTPTAMFLQAGGKSFDTSALYPAPFVKGQDFVQLFILVPGGVFNFGEGSGQRNSSRLINVVDNVADSVGVHQLKWGIDYRRLFPVFRQDPVQPTYFAFSENDLINSNLSLAYVGSLQIAHPIYTNISMYLQDTWRTSKRVTLTYGLRWDCNLAPGERDGIQPLNLVGLSNPATATLAPPNSPLYNTTYGNFVPRVGLAYQARQSPGRETVVRGGFGVFYDLNSESTANGFIAAPFSNFTAPVANVPFPVPNNFPPFTPVPPLPAPRTLPLSSIYAFDPHLKLPYTVQWSAAVEQGLGATQSISISYVAAEGHRLLREDQILNANANFPDIFATRNASSSNYEALQIQFNRRLSKALQGLASYTYSHSIDNASSAQNFFGNLTTGGLTFPNPNIDRGNSDFDMRHALRGAMTYDVPTWHAKVFSKALVGGWSIDVIGIAQTGLPVDLSSGTYSLPGAFNPVPLRPNIVSGIPLYISGSQCAAANGGVPCPGGRAINFTPGAVAGGCPDGSQSTGPFCPLPTAQGVPTQQQGTLGRNVLRDLGAWQMDVALHRRFTLTERVNLQFRSEFFNVFNHPNFGVFNQFLASGLFGRATATLNNSFGSQGINSLYAPGGPRSIQLALKLSF